MTEAYLSSASSQHLSRHRCKVGSDLIADTPHQHGTNGNGTLAKNSGRLQLFRDGYFVE
ncbi:hypothetical protein [Bradyrhizobium hipponense]|uniref:hypothetical protein n=1 Tax=Bradyrhizobium hipponense TaxID=2605638 RepID=UPI0016531C35|nr:hypothetical protein [Bradyrhizobium hipponense]